MVLIQMLKMGIIGRKRGAGGGGVPANHFYFEGNEYAELTGGWYGFTGNFEKNPDNMRIWTEAISSTFKYSVLVHDIPVDITNVNMIYFDCQNQGVDHISNNTVYFYVHTIKERTNWNFTKGIEIINNFSRQEVAFDVSDVTGNQYIHVYGRGRYSGNSNVTVFGIRYE